MSNAIPTQAQKSTGNRPIVLLGVLIAHITLLATFLTFSSKQADVQPQAKKEPIAVVMVQVVDQPVNASIVSAPQSGVVPVAPHQQAAETPRPASINTAQPMPSVKMAAPATPVKPQAVMPSSVSPPTIPNTATNSQTTYSEHGITDPAPAPGPASKTGSGEGTSVAASSGTNNTTGQGGAKNVGAFSPPRFGVAYLNNPPPKYPPIAKRMGEEGKVLLKVLVSAAGAAEEVNLHKSSGSETLDSAAIKAVRRWKFIPAKSGETALSAWVQVPIVFKLSQGD